MAKCIAFHSYKGGTGKTTLACNLAVSLAKKGFRVFLLDLDVSAPSIQAYFEKEPKKWVNDFLLDTADVDDFAQDMTYLIDESNQNTTQEKKGKLWVGFSNPKKEEIYKIEGGKEEISKMQLLRKFILLRERLISDYGVDYLVLDTSPGIRYWSINALAIADILFLTLKMGDLDIDGTKKMADDIYGSLTKFGAKSYLILNRVAGFCVPNNMKNVLSATESHFDHNVLTQQEPDVNDRISKMVGMEVISAIPCYCDIQFSRKEFLTVLNYPSHPFAEQISHLSEEKQIKV
ncbi:MAG: ParA family protein [Patescibacteria group bacterium]|nr:ParA family protein [Patescibacteria group bacterium]